MNTFITSSSHRSLHRAVPNLRTDFIAIQDSDDIARPDRIHFTVTRLIRSGADIFAAAAKRFHRVPGDARFIHRSLNAGCTDAAWLEHRVRLFERFTLPSVQAQTRQDFHWLLLCDRMTSGVWKNRLRALMNSENTHLVWTARGERHGASICGTC